jgi:hypothetical protein
VRGLRQRRHPEHVADPADRAARRLHVVETVAQRRHRSRQPRSEQQEGQQVGRGHATGRDQGGATDQHDQQHERRRQRQLHPRRDRGDAAHPPDEDVDEIVRCGTESMVGAPGSSERLDHRDALYELDDGAGDPPHGGVELRLLAEPRRRHHRRHQRHGQRHRYQRDQREPPVDGEQVDQRHQRHHECGDELAGGVGDERVHGTHVLPHHLCQLAGPASGEPADRYAPQLRGQLPAERQLHLAVDDVPDSRRCGREQQSDQQADRSRDHDGPDVTVIDRAGRQQGAAQFDHRQQRCQTRDGADHLQDHHRRETREMRAQ